MAYISNSREIQLRDCSLDYQHSVQEKRCRQQLICESVAAVATLAATIVVVIEPINQMADTAIAGIQFTAQTTGTAVKTGKSVWDSLIPDFRKPLQEGQRFLGYKVTSGFGKRKSPCPGCSTFHRGTDLATPKGTALRVPAPRDQTATIRCWRDGKGGGLVADIKSDAFPGYTFQALHLLRCSSGQKRGGEVFARTGDSGLGTGPHVDLRQIKGKKYEPIAKGIVFWMFQGKPPKGGAHWGDWQEGMNDG